MTDYTIWQDGQPVARCDSATEAVRYLRAYARDGYAELRAGSRKSGRLIAMAGKKETTA